jgi:hypothetical protein
MSLRTLSAIAVERDEATPPTAAPAPGARPPGTPPVPAPAPDASTLSAATGTLIAAIPGEVLAPYSALVGVIVSTNTAKDDHAALRWWVFGVAAALVVVTLLAGFYRNKSATGRAFPFVETVAATIAFAAWGLAMPGSPLSIDVTGDDLTIATAVIALGGAFMVTLVAPTIAKKSSKAT